jgi:hypothetical protein
VKAKAKVTYRRKNLHNPFVETRRKMPKVSRKEGDVMTCNLPLTQSAFLLFIIQTCNVWFPILKTRHPIYIQGASKEVLDNFSIERVIVFQKCFQGRFTEDSPRFIFCCSDWVEYREAIFALFAPVAPAIEAWLNLVSHDVEEL